MCPFAASSHHPKYRILINFKERNIFIDAESHLLSKNSAQYFQRNNRNRLFIEKNIDHIQL